MIEPTLIKPTRAVQPGERFDLIVGRFLAPGEKSTGTVRHIAVDDRGDCYVCGHAILAGQEVDEDFIAVHSKCGDKLDDWRDQ